MQMCSTDQNEHNLVSQPITSRPKNLFCLRQVAAHMPLLVSLKFFRGAIHCSPEHPFTRESHPYLLSHAGENIILLLSRPSNNLQLSILSLS